MKLSDLVASKYLTFTTQEDVSEQLKLSCMNNKDLASFEVIGKSEEGLEILAFVIGKGPLKVSLLAGSHADDPVGSSTIRLFIKESLKHRSQLDTLFDQYTFYCIPQINPDGEIRNSTWMEKWPQVDAYIKNVVRELPGKDIEFGYPELRSENKATAEFWKKIAPLDLHINLHGMGFAEGVSLLIERHWVSRTQEIRDGFTKSAKEKHLPLHTHNRKGEKGFFYIENGYSTTPEGGAMKAHFLAADDNTNAAFFHKSSMEYIRSLGGDPLCLVTEIPLFVINKSNEQTLIPENYLELKQQLPKLKSSIEKGNSITDELEKYGVKPVTLLDAIKLQLDTIELGLKVVR